MVSTKWGLIQQVSFSNQKNKCSCEFIEPPVSPARGMLQNICRFSAAALDGVIDRWCNEYEALIGICRPQPHGAKEREGPCILRVRVLRLRSADL